MKTGIELITQERKEQLVKHGRDKFHDELFEDGQLLMAALFAITEDSNYHQDLF